MMERMTIIDRLEIVAERGDTNAALKLWGAQISKLEKGGFTVAKIAPTAREGEFYCEVDWKQPYGPDAQRLLEYTLEALQANHDRI